MSGPTRSMVRSATATPPNVASAPSVTSSHRRRRPRRDDAGRDLGLDGDVARGRLAQLVAQVVEDRGKPARHPSSTVSRAVVAQQSCIVRRPRETRARMTSGVVLNSSAMSA